MRLASMTLPFFNKRNDVYKNKVPYRLYDTFNLLDGAGGFEPPVTGPKPDALPLGHAPLEISKLMLSRTELPFLQHFQLVYILLLPYAQFFLSYQH